MRPTRVCADDPGESHFEALEVTLAPTYFTPPAAPLNISSFLPTTEGHRIGRPSGRAGETPHPVARRKVFCAARGDYEATAGDGDTRTFRPGSVFRPEDTYGKGHTIRVLRDEGLLIFAVVLADSP